MQALAVFAIPFCGLACYCCCCFLHVSQAMQLLSQIQLTPRGFMASLAAAGSAVVAAAVSCAS
jgi:hypothetical protein